MKISKKYLSKNVFFCFMDILVIFCYILSTDGGFVYIKKKVQSTGSIPRLAEFILGWYN